MIESNLQQRVDKLFESALARTVNQTGLKNFHQLLKQCQLQLHQPMRVAIVGLIKAGKSTMMNALLGEDIVATGNVEATFNVNSLRYGEKPSLLVHFKDNRPSEAKSFEELAALTLRADSNRNYLLSIKYIEVFYPNKILETFNLIDTPGLLSYYKDDSENTLSFLQLYGRELTEITKTEAQGADAVLYLFSNSLATEDKETVEMFQGAVVGQATPINAIGVLTKVDNYWSDPNVSEPMEAGNRICQRLSTHSQVKKILYTVYPVCGLLALGAQTLTNDEYQILLQLAEIPEVRMDKLIRNVQRFCDREYPDISISANQRQQVFKRLGQYGVWLAHSLIRSGIINQTQLVEQLLKRSGITQLHDLILSHFGRRAFIIKLGNILRQIDVACFQEKLHLTGELKRIVEEIGGNFEALKVQEHSFAELKILRNYYNKKLDFDDEEVQHLLQVTGEFGTFCGERLGLDQSATINEMLTVAREKMYYWQQRASDSLGSDGKSIAAAGVLARSYEKILYRILKAKEYLYF